MRQVFTSTPLYLIGNLHQTTTWYRLSVKSISCILLGIYIKPQRSQCLLLITRRCILLGIYIKPQLTRTGKRICSVVSYWESTSNHNFPIRLLSSLSLYLIGNLHQTTTTSSAFCSSRRCILLGIYIKPQHHASRLAIEVVVSYWESTSNHNSHAYTISAIKVVSYWESTSNHNYIFVRNAL